jgi:uncharacterized protein (DUF1778 family)
MADTTQERGRITARVPQEVQDTLQKAADLQGATLNQFVVQAALNEARRVVERERLIELSGGDAAFLLKLLDEPPAPNARLAQALQRHGGHKGDVDHRSARGKAPPRRIRVRQRRA